MATTKAYELGQFGGTLDVDSADNITLTGNLSAKYAGFDSDFTAKSTSDLSEGTNLYYTDARADARIAAATTADLTEGSNLYYTTARSDSDTGVYISGNRTYGNITTTGYIAGPATMTIDPAAVGDNTGTLVIAGNLQVDGTTTTINSTTMEVDDLNLTLASGAANAAAANGAGITVDGASATITYDGTNDEWDFNKNVNVTGTVSSTQLINSGGTGTELAIVNDKAGGVGYYADNNGHTFKTYVGGWQTRLVVQEGGNVGIGTTNPSQIFEVQKAANDKLVYGSNPRLILDTPTGINGLRVLGDTTPFEFKIDSGTYNGSTFSMGGTGDVSLLGTTTTASDTFNDSPTFFFNSMRWNGSANTTHFQGAIKGHTRSATNGDGYLGIGANANANHLNIDASTGNVGIGTTNPGQKLTIEGTADNTNSEVRITATGVASGYLGADSNGFNIGTDTAGLYFKTGVTGGQSVGATGSARMVINSSGNVGIGTTNPSASLDVVSNSASGYVAEFRESNASNFGTILIDSPTDGESRPSYMDYATGGTVKWSTGLAYLDAARSFHIGTGSGLSNSKLTITTGGNVGIGTDNPQQLLHVNGGAGDTTIQITNSVSGSSATDGFSLTVENPSGDVNIRNREATNMRFYTNNTERMRITPSGTINTFSTVVGGYHYYTNSGTIDTDYLANSGYVFEVAGKVNPNSGGSTYVDPFFGHIYIGHGWNGSSLTAYIYYVALQPAARDVYPSGSGFSGDALEVCFVASGTEYTTVPVSGSSSYNIRVKALNYNSTYGSQFELHITRKA